MVRLFFALLALLAPATQAASTGSLLNVNFGHVESVKVGRAAVGLGDTDLWNHYSFPFLSFGSITNLKTSTGATTPIGLVAINGPGQWYNLTGDKMYDSYLYSETDIQVTIFNVPAGSYNLYLYGHGTLNIQNAKFEVSAGGVTSAIKATTQASTWSSLVWQENVQYVKFAIEANGSPIVVTCHRDGHAQAFINGLQLQSTGSAGPESVVITRSPQSTSVGRGGNVILSVSVTGDLPSYQWRKDGSNLTESAHYTGVTSSELRISSFDEGDAGVYDAVVSNSVSSATSGGATLTLGLVNLVNVNLGDATQVKVGPAAFGVSSADFWNQYSFPFAEFGSITNLKTMGREPTPIGFTVSNGPGQWYNTTGDMMYDGYVYSNGDITATIFNVPAGEYDLYLYGHGGVDNANTAFTVTSGARNFGTQATTKTEAWSSTSWQRNIQYVLFEGIQISGDTLVITGKKDGHAQSFLNGVQLRFKAEISNGPPTIVTQPRNLTVSETRRAEFSVVAWGVGSVTYQWRHEGTNLPAATAPSLVFPAATLADGGRYEVVVSNAFGSITSEAVTFAVEGADLQAPVVSITSPVAGPRGDERFSLEGTVSDNQAVTSVTWEFNGVSKGPLSLTDGKFKVTDLTLAAHVDNRIRVIARDGFDNVGEAVVVTFWEAPRSFVLGSPGSRQEGARFSIPLHVVSAGDVSGATFNISWDTNLLTDATFEWSESMASAFTAANLELNKRFRASFALPAVTVANGTTMVANVSFRVRSISAPVTTPVNIELVDVYGSLGDQFTGGNDFRSAAVLLTKRKIKGDNNANDRLDVGDASVMMRFISGLDPTKTWDRTGNDLNANLSVDSGDVIKVLRAVVGIDPQPVVPAGLKAGDGGSPVAGLNNVEMSIDKPTAAAGEKVTVEARITGQTRPITGASFRLEYPVAALRLENSTAHQVGPMAPTSGALLAWNVSPNVTDYAAQNGAISLGVSSATAWPTNNGVLARFTFTVQPGAPARYSWPIVVRNLEVSHNGFENELLGGGALNFVARAPVSANFEPTIRFGVDGGAKLTLQGDLGATYVVRASSDLVNWTVLGTFSTTTSGAIEISDPDSVGTATRFYKATLE